MSTLRPDLTILREVCVLAWISAALRFVLCVIQPAKKDAPASPSQLTDSPAAQKTKLVSYKTARA